MSSVAPLELTQVSDGLHVERVRESLRECSAKVVLDCGAVSLCRNNNPPACCQSCVVDARVRISGAT